MPPSQTGETPPGPQPPEPSWIRETADTFRSAVYVTGSPIVGVPLGVAVVAVEHVARSCGAIVDRVTGGRPDRGEAEKAKDEAALKRTALAVGAGLGAWALGRALHSKD